MIMESKVNVEELQVLGAYEGLLDNVEIVDKDSKIDFKAFLEGEKNTVAINSWSDQYTVFYKANLTDNLVLIYHQKYNDYPFYNSLKSYSPINAGVDMIYNNISNTLYINCYEYGQKFLKLEGLNLLNISDFKDSLQKDINKRIIEIVNNNVDNLNLSDEEIEEYNKEILQNNDNYCVYKRRAIELLVKGEEVNLNSYARFIFDTKVYSFYNDGFKECYICFDDFNVIKAIHNKEVFINEIVSKILSEFKNPIYKSIIKNNKIFEFMEELKYDEDLSIVRNVTSVLKNGDMKTLNITYKRNGEEMTFKIEGNPHIQNSNKGFYISSYYICNRNERATFERMFREESAVVDIYLLNIESITYGRKVLYKK